MPYFLSVKFSFIFFAIVLCAPLLSTPVQGDQAGGSYPLRVEDRPDMPVKIISARVTSYPAGNLDVYLQVENIGNRTVRTFSVVFPDGARRYERVLEPGKVLKIEEYNLQAELKETQHLALRGKLSSWVAIVGDVQFAGDGQGDERGEVLVQLDVSAVSYPSTGIDVSLPAYEGYFLDESDLDLRPRFGLEVLGWARTHIEIHNTSTESLCGIRYKLEGEIGSAWVNVGRQLILALLAPDEKTLIPVLVPVEVLYDGTKLRIQKLRLDVTEAFPEYDRSGSSADRPESYGASLTLVSQTNEESGADEMPSILKSAPVRYTEEALKNKTQGVVRIKALIGIDGTVKDPRVTRHLPDGLDMEALAAVYGTKFKPALRASQPIPVWQIVEVAFSVKQ